MGGSWRRTAAARAMIRSLKLATPACSMTSATWMCSAEYAKASPDDMLIRITIVNRGPDRLSCTCCRRFGFATPGRGAARTRAATIKPRLSPRQATNAVAARPSNARRIPAGGRADRRKRGRSS